jgi:hypothetical protein
MQRSSTDEIKNAYNEIALPVSSHITLSDEQLSSLTVYALPHIRAALQSTAKWLAKHLAVGRKMQNRPIFQSIEGSCKWHAERATKKKPSVCPAPAQRPTPRTRTKNHIIEELRSTFQERCTNDNDWTLTENDCAELLKTYDEKTLCTVFAELGRFDGDYNSQDKCFARLNDILDQITWQEAMAAQ